MCYYCERFQRIRQPHIRLAGLNVTGIESTVYPAFQLEDRLALTPSCQPSSDVILCPSMCHMHYYGVPRLHSTIAFHVKAGQNDDLQDAPTPNGVISAILEASGWYHTNKSAIESKVQSSRSREKSEAFSWKQSIRSVLNESWRYVRFHFLLNPSWHSLTKPNASNKLTVLILFALTRSSSNWKLLVILRRNIKLKYSTT